MFCYFLHNLLFLYLQNHDKSSKRTLESQDTTTILRTQKLWPLLAGGCCSEVALYDKYGKWDIYKLCFFLYLIKIIIFLLFQEPDEKEDSGSESDDEEEEESKFEQINNC
jgi:hypothetical protein